MTKKRNHSNYGSDTEGGTDHSERGSEKKSAELKQEHLVDWLTQMLVDHMKKLVAVRTVRKMVGIQTLLERFSHQI